MIFVPNKKRLLCPLCNQPGNIFSFEDKFYMYCEANYIRKDIEKDLPRIISKASDELFEDCVFICILNSYWERVRKIYQSTVNEKSKKFCFQFG